MIVVHECNRRGMVSAAIRTSMSHCQFLPKQTAFYRHLRVSPKTSFSLTLGFPDYPCAFYLLGMVELWRRVNGRLELHFIALVFLPGLNCDDNFMYFALPFFLLSYP